MSKQIFRSEKVNSFRLKPDQAERLNKILGEAPPVNVGEAVLFFASQVEEQKGVSKGVYEQNLATLNDRILNLQRRNADLTNAKLRLEAEQAAPPYSIKLPAYVSLKKELEAVLFPGEDNPPVISDVDFITLLVDTCQRDPYNEFPSTELAQAIYDKHKKTATNVQKQEEETTGAGDGTTTGTSGATENSGDVRNGAGEDVEGS